MTRPNDQDGVTRDASVRHLLARVAVVEERVRALVAIRRAGDPQPDDPFRGLYLTDETVDHLLEGPAPQGTPDPALAARLQDC